MWPSGLSFKRWTIWSTFENPPNFHENGRSFERPRKIPQHPRKWKIWNLHCTLFHDDSKAECIALKYGWLSILLSLSNLSPSALLTHIAQPFVSADPFIWSFQFLSPLFNYSHRSPNNWTTHLILIYLKKSLWDIDRDFLYCSGFFLFSVELESKTMASRPLELRVSIKLRSCTVIMLLFFAPLLGFAACASRHAEKGTVLVSDKMDEYPQQTLLSTELGFSSQTKIYKRSRRSSPLKTKSPRILHEVHSGPNPISNSFPMQADDMARKLKPKSQRKSPWSYFNLSRSPYVQIVEIGAVKTLLLL